MILRVAAVWNGHRMLSRVFISLMASVPFLAGGAYAQRQGEAQSSAQTTVVAKQVTNHKAAPVLVQADDLVYDNRNNRVIARGHVEIYQDENILFADEVIYDKSANTLTAMGNVRLKEADGSVVNADRLTLKSNFRDGFVRSLRALTQDDTRIAAANAYRKDNQIIYDKGMVTACKPDENHPKRPPCWRVKATRIIHDKDDHNFYFENAQFEVFGLPIAWVPYFYTPDNTVKQRSGFLTPTFDHHTATTGYSTSIPYYFALAPDYDLTVTPTITTHAGYMTAADWRQKFWNGGYEVKLYGAYNDQANSFLGDRNWRGSVETQGSFEINKYWRVGWNGIVESDDTFRRFYNIDSIYATSRVSTLYLTGQGDRNYFNVSVNRYGNLLGTTYDYETNTYTKSVTATSYPSVDYNYIHNKAVLGGELSFDVNALALQINDPVNMVKFPGLPIASAGLTDHVASDVQWRRTLKDDLGQVYTPFVFGRADVYNFSSFQDLNGASGPGQTVTRQMAGAGLDYRYPFVASSGSVSQVVEPVAQIITRGGQVNNNKIPNQDAQSLVFDDTLLFNINKFSGYDQVETGTRTNFGLQYTAAINGLSWRTVAGESIHLSGQNPYALYYGSGLQTDRSDYVVGTYVDYKNLLRATAQLRLNEKDFSVDDQTYSVQAKFGFLQLGTAYEWVAAQPVLGFPNSRQEVSGFGALKITDEWSIYGDARYDLALGQFIRNSAGVQYNTDCVVYSVMYQQTWVTIQDIKPDTAVVFRVGIKGFGNQTTPTSIYDISPEAAAFR